MPEPIKWQTQFRPLQIICWTNVTSLSAFLSVCLQSTSSTLPGRKQAAVRGAKTIWFLYWQQCIIPNYWVLHLVGYWLTPSTKYNQHFLLVLLRDHNICNTIIHNYWVLRLLARTLLVTWATTIYHDTTLSICGRNLCCQWGAMSVVYVFDLLYPLHGSIVCYQAEDEEWMYSHSCSSRMECIEKYNTLYNYM